MQTRIFTAAITVVSRLLVLRDRLLGRLRPIHPSPAESKDREVAAKQGETAPDAREPAVSRLSIPSGANTLDAVFVRPAGGPTKAVILICHGIGEIVEHWLPVQRLLTLHGAASLVFDYSGYGRSSGRVSPRQFELDTIAAFHHLRQLAPQSPLTLLGFSLGSGAAAAVVNRLPVHRLVLCAAFPSFRAAVHSTGVPRWLAKATPDIWKAEESLRGCAVPILIVHGEKDSLFPVSLARQLAACCPPETETIVVPGLGHNQPFYRPHPDYWRRILDWLAEPVPREDAPEIHLNREDYV